MPDCLAIVKRFDRIAAADDAAFLDPALEARSIIQRQIDRQAEKFLEILAGKIKPPSKEDGGADAEALSDNVIQGDASHREVTTVVGRLDLYGTGLNRRIVACKCLKHLHLQHSDLAEIGFCGIGAGAKEIPVAFDAAAGDEVCLGTGLYRPTSAMTSAPDISLRCAN